MDEKTLFAKLDTCIKENTLLSAKSTIIVGLSGGPDSVFLLHLLKGYQKAYDLSLIAAHLDHEWRPESQDDAAFCLELAQSLKIPCIVEKLSNVSVPLNYNGSQEAWARSARQHFFSLLQKKYAADCIALGHHADDQLENFFIRLIRGTTLAGLGGMKIKNGPYIRPLLLIKKTEILTYLNANALAYRLDLSNHSDAFLRNRLRNQVIPALKKCDERLEKNFLRTIASLQETDSFITNYSKKLYETISNKQENGRSLPRKAFLDIEPFLQNHLITHWLIDHKLPFLLQQSFIEEIKKFFHSQHAKKHTLHTRWYITREKEEFFIISI